MPDVGDTGREGYDGSSGNSVYLIPCFYVHPSAYCAACPAVCFLDDTAGYAVSRIRFSSLLGDVLLLENGRLGKIPYDKTLD